MFDRLEDTVNRYEDITAELGNPDVVNDQEKFRKLMKEQSSLAPLIETYTEYKNCKKNIEDSLAILDEETGYDADYSFIGREGAYEEEDWIKTSGLQKSYDADNPPMKRLRVYKGGSWADVAYWLSPGTRRYLFEDSATSTIGFRCAMIRAGSNF